MIIDRSRLIRGISVSSLDSNRSSKWRIGDLLLLVLLLILNIPVYYFQPFERQFYINDLTISHPYAEHQRVSDFMLFVYSLIVPLITMAIVWFLFSDAKHRWHLLYVSVLGLVLSVTSVALFTNFVKNWFGRARPDFLARCIPTEGTPINVLVNARDVCTSKDWDKILEGFRTTPSGHSSESFAGLGFLYFWLSGQLLTGNIHAALWTKAIALLPLLGATLIALSRTQDYRHHFIDVLLGSFIGFVFAFCTYRRYFPSIYDPLPFKPLLDDSNVTLQNNDHHYLPTSNNINEEVDPESRPFTV
ncbi:hypothetical protein TPHA_0D01760 [Tetrapisispora phaffii CBS 4417]|uniref:Phosphatidic acid phosphatase type 2/haloperoxidase domain-containing protein n=1 Tax=Tetrapisispora phaffii (strain ATCC 24235 / CBS 4417 / NBRC 1672 / NRRL Y-8282 / UCD 70-5) TaxID=1071381 RepID=G8BSJ4_TETPH|nr:hypothetical protein TPHA_0D01760 [Tetrapisispora phaffii CBS 4417]CCE62815.1 hypothetical protein TPHA_0D01760 [Tetrapisispora phaffii CBS 4417]